MKILVINPTISGKLKVQPDSLPCRRIPRYEISLVCLERGPASIESDYDVAVAVPDILGHVIRAEHKGMDAVVIDPTGVALKQAESLVALGLSHSKQTFPMPPRKKITGYDSHQVS